MPFLSRPLCTLLLAAAVLFAFASAPTVVYADDPPPVDPTMDPSGGPGGPPPAPSPASPEVWESTVVLILAIYPDADYDTICYYALVWYNLLPPDYSDPPSSDSAPPPVG